LRRTLIRQQLPQQVRDVTAETFVTFEKFIENISALVEMIKQIILVMIALLCL